MKRKLLLIELRRFLLITSMLAIIVISCKKDKRLAQMDENITVLSKNSPDYFKRISAIKDRFYSSKFDQKLIANVNQKYSWTPDWEHPSSQVVNDSVSYVFFPLIAYVKENNVTKNIIELGSAHYLIIKNEKEFYKAFYYQTKAPNNTSKLTINKFTGNLLLTNFENGKSYLLDYVDGKVSQSYQKRKMLALNRESITFTNKISYWESICHTELKYCTWASDGPTNCNSGTVHIIYSENCNWPQGNCGSNYSLIDSSEITVCQDQWFPDPPTDPGDNGGGSGGGGESGTTPEQFNQRINLDELSPCASSVLHSLMYQSSGSVVSMIQKFSGEVPGYTWNLKSGTLGENENGSTTKTTGGASTTIDVSKYKNGTDVALARTLLHEAVHAYLVSYFANNPVLAQLSYPDMLIEWQKQKKPNLNDVQHIEITIEFKDDIAAGLMEYGDLHNITFPTPAEKTQFYSDMAWGGLEATPAYKALSQSDKDRIQDTIVAEQYGTDRNGTPKSGKGTISGC